MKKEKLRNILGDKLRIFSEATGVELFFLKTGGLVSSPCIVSSCPYFNTRKCYSCLEAASRSIIFTGSSSVIKCKFGLSLIAAPIYVKSQYKGTLLVQPFFVKNSTMNENYINESALRIGVDREKLNENLRRLPVYSFEKIAALISLVKMFHGEMSLEDVPFPEKESLPEYSYFAGKNQFDEMRKKAETDLDRLQTYSNEAEFENAVKCNDKKTALESARKLLSEIMYISGGDVKVLKYRIIQLAVMMNRLHANKDNASEIFFDTAEFMFKAESLQDNDAALRFFAEYIDNFLTLNDEANKNINYSITMAKEYIRKNCTRELTLKEVAEKVFLSASYFSRIFKQKTGEKFIDYLNRIRIEESMVYLKDLSMDMAQITRIMGFSDQSYYTKVFKKFVGVSPNVYRRNFKLEADVKRRKEKRMTEKKNTLLKSPSTENIHDA